MLSTAKTVEDESLFILLAGMEVQTCPARFYVRGLLLTRRIRTAEHPCTYPVPGAFCQSYKRYCALGETSIDRGIAGLIRPTSSLLPGPIFQLFQRFSMKASVLTSQAPKPERQFCSRRCHSHASILPHSWSVRRRWEHLSNMVPMLSIKIRRETMPFLTGPSLNTALLIPIVAYYDRLRNTGAIIF